MENHSLNKNIQQQQNTSEILFSPDSHSLNVGVATVTRSAEAALIFNHLFFWIKLNKQKGINQIDGRTWMFQTINEMLVHFPYLSEKLIKISLGLLVEHGYILKSNYNENKFDKTNWYALAKEEWVGEFKKMFAMSPIGPIDKSQGADRQVPGGRCIYKDKDNRIEDNRDIYAPSEDVAKSLPSFKLSDAKKSSKLPFSSSILIEKVPDNPSLEKFKKSFSIPLVGIDQKNHESLISQYGEDLVRKAYMYLAEWKLSKAEVEPKAITKHSDYYRITKWVMKEVMANSEGNKSKSSEVKVGENEALAKRVGKKFPKEVSKNLIVLGNNYIEFCHGITSTVVKFSDNGFKEQILHNLRRLNLPTQDFK